ncbi:hypothetical protein ACSBR2_033876 [Camellia fascicularis]
MVQNIRNFILNHSMALSIFNEYSVLRLLSVAKTRFASNIIMALRLREVKTSLEKMVMDANWKIHREDSNMGQIISTSLMSLMQECLRNLSWWANHGASTPLIQALAFKLLVQPASPSCCERNWKKLTSRAKDLIFVHCNLRLLSKKSKEYKKGPTKYWDICGDLFDIEGREMMELAQLSLDDPEMQTMTLDDDYEFQQLVPEDSTN